MKIATKVQQGICVIELSEFMDHESQTLMAQIIANIKNENIPWSGIIVDFKNLRFVGSSFMSNVIQEITVLNQISPKLYLSNVGSDFQKVIKIYGTTLVFQYANKIEEAQRQILQDSTTTAQP